MTPNAAWRNVDLPSLAADGATRLKNPPLALDLHYLLTAYASEDAEAEALLGYAILMLHENPILPRALISTVSATLPATPLQRRAEAPGSRAQIEMIKITPATLGREEMAWLWTALKADYRPTFPFQASVVLIEPEATTVSALPVLRRSISAISGLAPPFPALSAVVPPAGASTALLGDTVTVEGTNLGAVTGVRLVNSGSGSTT